MHLHQIKLDTPNKTKRTDKEKRILHGKELLNSTYYISSLLIQKPIEIFYQEATCILNGGNPICNMKDNKEW